TRWGEGDCTPVEHYLALTPALPREAVVDLIHHELLLREERGDAPELDEYLRRFPEYTTEVKLLFEVLGSADDSWPSGSETTPSPSAPPSIPGFEILEPLGKGGMGRVYRARQLRLDRFVALKLLPKELVANEQALTRFHREARTASAISHPHICTVYDLG